MSLMTFNPNHTHPLTEDEMRNIAPSIFTETAHESRSDKFKPISTIEVLRGLQKEGFFPVSVHRQGARIAGRELFNKHLIRMRRFDDAAKNLVVGDTTFEVLLKNANDGTSVWNVMGGLWKLLCSNGMVVGNTYASFKVRHMLSDPNPRAIMDKVIEGTYKVLSDSENILEAPRKWSQIFLPSPVSYSLAINSHRALFGDKDGNIFTPVKPEQLLVPRREEDKGQDLWSVFNVIQENALKGGIEASNVSITERWGRVETRMRTHAINAIDRSVKLNRTLFDLAADVAKELA